MWRLFAPCPKAVEYSRYFMGIESDAMRLVRLGGAFDSARKLCELFNDGKLCWIAEKTEIGVGERFGAKVRAGKASCALPSTEHARACAYCT